MIKRFVMSGLLGLIIGNSAAAVIAGHMAFIVPLVASLAAFAVHMLWPEERRDA